MDRRMDRPKPICPLDFFEVGGIKTVYQRSNLTLIAPEQSKLKILGLSVRVRKVWSVYLIYPVTGLKKKVTIVSPMFIAV